MAIAIMLAGCSGGARVSQYSPKVVADGDPVPKGGGAYKLGKPYTINGRTYHPTADTSYRAEGIASWYGPDFHGRKTANGEVYDMHALSAAHPTMPMPSYARVTNLENGKSIIVRVNDRGPYSRNRIIDLSIGTAKALDFYGRGLARVRVEYVGRAGLHGSDDRMLMATLREGSPAPAPSLVRVASPRPLLGESRDREARSTQAARRNSSDAAPPRARPSAPELAHASERPAAPAPTTASVPAAASITPAFAPGAGSAYGASSLGLMSGRGLY
jgi:rare lipoprotein A